MKSILCLSICLLTIVPALLAQQPPTPSWPEMFNSHFDVLVEDYGPDWKAVGVVNYNWMIKTFRADFIDWCLPLFGSGLAEHPTEFENYTCSFLATKGNMYFVNHTSKIWEENECCLFEAGLGAVAPDWMKAEQYNGTITEGDYTLDVWWFPGTNDPNEPCYGYWNIRDKLNTPHRFFGLSSLGATILNYRQFKPGVNDEDKKLSVPNAGCDKECKPPVTQRGEKKMRSLKDWPHNYWPSCE